MPARLLSFVRLRLRVRASHRSRCGVGNSGARRLGGGSSGGLGFEAFVTLLAVLAVGLADADGEAEANAEGARQLGGARGDLVRAAAAVAPEVLEERLIRLLESVIFPRVPPPPLPPPRAPVPLVPYPALSLPCLPAPAAIDRSAAEAGTAHARGGVRSHAATNGG
jgi:hypothetical protein